MTGVLNELVTAVQGIRTFLGAPDGPQPPGAIATASPSHLPPWQPPPSSHVSPPAISNQPPSTAQGVPITQVRFPPSPSPLPDWLAAPLYTAAPSQPTALQPPAPSSAAPFGGLPGYAAPHAGVEGPLFHGGPLVAAPSASASSLLRHEGAYPAGAHGQQPPRFSKLEFATYDGSVDPLNWLNRCEQFFRGQRTLASDRTWLASYHLRGAAQTWYYALEQDEGGMPPWERFRDLCLLRFGPPIRGSRLAELGRLPFTSSVQDFADRFQTLACHAPGVTARQRAELFVGGLPDHLRVDVEMRDPQDLQTAMYYARAYEQRALALQQSFQGRGARPPPRPAPGRQLPPRPHRLQRGPSAA